jgi:hypothetical protein
MSRRTGKPGEHRFREEAINVLLGTLLAGRGLDANAETIKAGGRPDVLINLGGLKLILEGRQSNLRNVLYDDAEARIEDGLADFSIAVLYPAGLESARDMDELKANIEAARFDGAIFFIDGAGIARKEFSGASLDDLIQLINTVFRQRVQNDVVRQQVTQLEETITEVVDRASKSDLFFDSDVLENRLKHALGMSDGEAEEE